MAPSLTRLLADVRDGDPDAAGQVFPLAYGELRRLAASMLRNQRPGHTLQPTALVHEAYLKLLGDEPPDFQSRAHFFAVAARVMRQILVDHARSHMAEKRGGGAPRVPLDEAIASPGAWSNELIVIDEALEELARFDARKAQVIEMAYFAGMTGDEIAEALSISVRTVTRDLRMAEAWLSTRLAR